MTGTAGGYVDDRAAIESSASGVAWGAILGGAVASVAIAVLLVTLGSGLGLASVSPWANSGASATTFTVVTGIWLICMHWLASGLGGYLTGRLRTKWAGLTPTRCSSVTPPTASCPGPSLPSSAPPWSPAR